MKKSICIISFSPIFRDGRVLRQIKFLSANYSLTVIGYGHPHSSWKDIPDFKFIPITGDPARSWRDRIIDGFYTISGTIFSISHERWYWRRGGFRQALKAASHLECEAFLANEWEALPVAAEAARAKKAKLIFDAHEYSPLLYENDWKWESFYKPHILYILKKYTSWVNASMTVAPDIARRYQQEYDLDPIVLLNVPEWQPVPDRDPLQEKIRIIHHGSAMRDRKLEKMIKTIALCNQRYSLYFMLVEHNPGYIQELQQLANQLAPGRVFFLDPVSTEKVVSTIAAYDIGLYLLEPTSYNNLVALPNKFFDFIAANLAVCIGPSPSMAEIINLYHFGCISPSFQSEDAARILNELSIDEIVKMQQAARQASEQINAENEMQKLLDLISGLF